MPHNAEETWSCDAAEHLTEDGRKRGTKKYVYVLGKQRWRDTY